MSLNAWCGALLDPLLRWLPGVGADVLCLQEVTWTPGHDGWVTYADGARTSRQRASLFDDLRRALPDHQATFLACDTGPVIDENGRRQRQQFGIATFVAPHRPVIGTAAAFVHGGFAHHDAWPAQDRGRQAHVVRVVDDAGDPVTVAHLHGVRMDAGKIDTPGRRRQAERLAELVEQVRRPGDTTVVAGDLNVLPGSETFTVLAGSGLVDLVGDAPTRTSAYPKPVRHGDYLLVSDGAPVAAFEIVTAPEVSDHCPLVLDLGPVRHQAD